MDKYYITTAIDYPNSSPHMGHAYEKILADVLARWNRLEGKDVFFSYGLDEHGQKIYTVAQEKGLEPKEFVDKQAKIFREFVENLSVSYDGFVRTTDEHHEKYCQDMFQKVLDKGDIYKGEYKGYYCIYEESFYTERQLLEGKRCPECGRETKIISEEAYFFRLSKYKDQIIQHIENNPDFIYPLSRRNEVLSRLKDEELRDVCVSRSTFSWGIPLPNDKDHIIYVWFEALPNYLSVVDYPNTHYWPPEVQVIGKDILWFHAVLWPGMLMSLDIPQPKTVYAHGFINDKNGQAMSKSLGNISDPKELSQKYSSDALRYYILRITPSGDDGNFSEGELVQKYNNELGNELGNLVKRIEVLTTKYFEGKISNEDYPDEIKTLDSLNEIREEMNNLRYSKALEKILKQLHNINSYITKKEPWKNEDERKKVLYNVIENLRFVVHFLQPYIPDTCTKISQNLGFDLTTFSELEFGTNSYELEKHDILFPKIEYQEKEQFSLNLEVGEITEVEKAEGADNLYVEQVDLGDEKRQIVSGLAPYYSKEELKGKRVIIVTNLKSAKLKGIESQGMLLAAEKDDKVKLLESPSATPGSKVNVEGYENNEEEIDIKQFSKVKMEVKEGNVFYKGQKLKSGDDPVKVDIEDGAKVE